MELKVCRVGEGYGVLLPQVLLDELAVGEGSILRAESRDGVLHVTPVDADFAEQMDAFFRTEDQHRNSYRELSK